MWSNAESHACGQMRSLPPEWLEMPPSKTSKRSKTSETSKRRKRSKRRTSSTRAVYDTPPGKVMALSAPITIRVGPVSDSDPGHPWRSRRQVCITSPVVLPLSHPSHPSESSARLRLSPSVFPATTQHHPFSTRHSARKRHAPRPFPSLACPMPTGPPPSAVPGVAKSPSESL
jgi:hypothetical protein